MKTIKHKRLFALCSAILLCLSFSANINAAQTRAVDWYVKKNDTHTQPPLESGLQFIENYNCYYLDKSKAGENGEKVLYLTFDAGYENGNIAKILETLRAHKVHAAFFLLEHIVKKESELVRQIATDGHLICNHTAKHRDMSKYTDFDSFAEELLAFERACKEHIGVESAKYYRPPEGRFSELNLEFTDRMGYATVLWSFAYADWDNDRQQDENKALKIILDNIHNGGVLLLHPTSATNAAIMDKLLTTLKNDGYRFASLDELTKESQ